jgi:alpha-ribazole phosphatase
LVPPGLCYGAMDMAADEKATRDCAQSLAVQLPAGTRVLSSPLVRCRQLAAALVQQRPDLQWGVDGRLAEMDFGTWEGWRWQDIPKADIDQWMAEFGSWRFGGRESVDGLMARVGAMWQETLEARMPTAWLCHAGVARAASLHARGVVSVSRASDWPRSGLDFGAWMCL